MKIALNGRDKNIDCLVTVSKHCSCIFPATTDVNCILTAHADAHEWSGWVEVADTTDVTPLTLSAKFAALPGHIAGMVVESTNQASTTYMIELSYGAAKTCISRWRFMSETNHLPAEHSARVRGPHIPAGETVYARAMCETAGAKTANVHFRYFYHE